jgi:hypothetical protein
MFDWRGSDELVAQKLEEGRARGLEPRYRPPPARGLVSWLRRLIARSKPPEEVKEPSAKPAFR